MKTATAVPAGFTVTQAEGAFGVTHDFDKDPVVMGKCVDIRSVEMGTGKNKKKRRIMTVRTKEGDRQVWESSQLSGVFNAKGIKGKQVFFRKDGVKKFKITKGPDAGTTAKMNLFTAAFK
jgi:hypothetical protein